MSTPVFALLLLATPFVVAELGCITNETRSLSAIQVTESDNVYYYESGSLLILGASELSLRLVGYGIDRDCRVLLTTYGPDATRGDECQGDAVLQSGTRSTSVTLPQGYDFQQEDDHLSSGLFKFNLEPTTHDEWYYFCIRVNSTESGVKWQHQGISESLRLKPYTSFLPTWVVIILIALLLMLSGLFSGLNLGLMSLDPTELSIVSRSGTPAEKRFAKAIIPVRRRGSFLLCTLLFGNVLVNSSLTILLDMIGGGTIAIVASTLGIVIFGEIVPQAICSRHGLAVGARTIWITKIFMGLTFPLSFPMSKILDCILGAELGQVYNRDRLQELIKLADKQDIVNEEINIIQGALQLTKKCVVDVMTPLEDVFMLAHGAVLDFDTMSRVMNTGYTRIPVYETDRTNIIAILNIKDLAFVDPDDNIPLKTVCRFYNHPIVFVFNDTRLDELLEEFKKGKSHMSFVQRVVEEAGRDPFYEIVGLVTLEDVIEEIIQSEILDETDIIIDNKTKRRRQQVALKRDYSVFNTTEDSNHRHRISPQLALASFQYLSTTVDPFKPEYLSANVLKRLLKQDILVSHKLSTEKATDNLLYTLGKPTDYFVMITEGRCRVDIGRDSMTFEVGPFAFFGTQALLAGGVPTTVSTTPVRQKAPGKDELHRASASSLTELATLKGNAYVPDYSLVALTDVQMLRIRRLQYVAAVRATLMERHPNSPKDPQQTDVDVFSLEWQKASKITLQQADAHRSSQDGLGPGPHRSTSNLPDELHVATTVVGRKKSLPGLGHTVGQHLPLSPLASNSSTSAAHAKDGLQRQANVHHMNSATLDHCHQRRSGSMSDVTTESCATDPLLNHVDGQLDARSESGSPTPVSLSVSESNLMG